MSATVVIALYNGAATVGDQLDALAGQAVENLEVVVADNGSTDSGREIVRSHPLGPRVVDGSQVRGQAHARNVGAEAATGDLLLFCDQDDVVAPGWAAALRAALARWDLVGGSLETERLNKGTSHWQTTPTNPLNGKPLPFAAGANFGIRRSVFEKLGGWDVSLRGGGEDAALCWAAQLAGYTFGYVPEAQVYYRFRHSLVAHCRQQFAYGRQMTVARCRFPALGEPHPASWPRTAAWAVRHAGMAANPDAIGQWAGALAYRAGLSFGLRQQAASACGSAAGAAT